MEKRPADVLQSFSGEQDRSVKIKLSENHGKESQRTLLHGGYIITCIPRSEPGEPVLQEYRWMLVCDGRVERIGTGELPEVEHTVARIDLKGRLVLPGLFDSHCHVFYQGKMQQSLVLEGTKSIEELQAKLTRFHREHPDLQVIEGNQWDQELLGRFPNRHDLDVVPVPVMLYRRCWHICCVNSAALEACSIQGGEVIEGGAIDVDDDGVATGLVREAAMDAFLQNLKTAGSEEQHRQFLQQGMNVFMRFGCTSVLTNDGMQIGGIPKPWDRYHELAMADKMPIRIFLTIDWKELDKPGAPPPADSVRDMRTPPWLDRCFETPGNEQSLPRPTADGRFTMSRVKLWTDGALGASTAALEEPYSDDPEGKNTGILQISQDMIRRAVGLASRNSFGVEAHTIGDRSARELIDAFEAHGVSEKHRFTMTHCQILSASLIDRMAKLGVVASIQPQFTTSDASIAASRLGDQSVRFRHSYVWRSMRQAGVHLAGGSDAPVEEPNPLLGMYRAMVNDIHASECLTFAEALEMYTLGGAYAAFREQDLGALQEGFCADFIITSLEGGTSLVSDPAHFCRAQVDEVWVHGRCEYRAAPNVTVSEAVSVYLPKELQGIAVLHQEGEGKYHVDTELYATTVGVPDFGRISYRLSKNLTDKADLIVEDGESVEGVDEGDGWVMVKVNEVVAPAPVHVRDGPGKRGAVFCIRGPCPCCKTVPSDGRSAWRKAPSRVRFGTDNRTP